MKSACCDDDASLSRSPDRDQGARSCCRDAPAVLTTNENHGHALRNNVVEVAIRQTSLSSRGPRSLVSPTSPKSYSSNAPCSPFSHRSRSASQSALSRSGSLHCLSSSRPRSSQAGAQPRDRVVVEKSLGESRESRESRERSQGSRSTIHQAPSTIANAAIAAAAAAVVASSGRRRSPSRSSLSSHSISACAIQSHMGISHSQTHSIPLVVATGNRSLSGRAVSAPSSPTAQHWAPRSSQVSHLTLTQGSRGDHADVSHRPRLQETVEAEHSSTSPRLAPANDHKEVPLLTRMQDTHNLLEIEQSSASSSSNRFN